MLSILIVTAVMGCVHGSTINMNNACDVQFNVLIDCTNLQEDYSVYEFKSLSDNIKRLEFTRLTGLVNLENLPGVNMIEVAMGDVSCKNVKGNIAEVTLQSSMETLICLPNGDDIITTLSPVQLTSAILPSTAAVSLPLTSTSSSLPSDDDQTSATPTHDDKQTTGTSPSQDNHTSGINKATDITTSILNITTSVLNINSTTDITMTVAYSSRNDILNLKSDLGLSWLIVIVIGVVSVTMILTDIIIGTVVSSVMVIIIIIIFIVMIYKRRRNRIARDGLAVENISLDTLSGSVSEGSSLELWNIQNYKRD